MSLTEQPVMRGIDEELRDLVNTKGTSDSIPLAHDIAEMQRLKNKHFPMHMYHDTLEPRVAINGAQKDLLIGKGYGQNYKHKDFPCMVFRRNMELKFQGDAFVESRTVNTKAERDKLSDWVESPAELAPLPDAPVEDPRVVIARLEERLANAENNKKPAK